MADDIGNLSPAEATSRLQAMSPAPAPTGLAERDPATLTPADARARLAELQSDKEWTARFLSGGLKERKQFDALFAKQSEATDAKLEIAMRNGVEVAPLIPEVTYDGDLNTARLAQVITDLRADGLEDDHIQELFENAPIAKELHDAAQRLRQRRFADPQYLDRYLKGGAAEKREQLLIGIILGRPIAEAA
jgi:hypothetical protein